MIGGADIDGTVKEICDLIMNRKEARRLPGRLEAHHDTLSPARWLVRILRPIVEPLVLTVFDSRHDFARGDRHCCFSSLRSNRLAAFASRRLWTRTSSTTPF
jgi:hypothetical protein